MKTSYIYALATLFILGLLLAPTKSFAFKYNPAKITDDNADEIYEQLKELDPTPAKVGDFGFYKIPELRPDQIPLGEHYADEEGAEDMVKSKTKRRAAALRKAVPMIHCIYQDENGETIEEHRLADRHHETYETWYWLDKGRTVGYIHEIVRATNKVELFTKLIQKNFMYTGDENGKMIVDPKNIRKADVLKLIELMPKTIMGMRNDKYRSLAGMARKKGAFAKGGFFSEFIWGNFYRTRIKIFDTEAGWAKAVDEAIELSHSSDASALPGFLGSCAGRLRKSGT